MNKKQIQEILWSKGVIPQRWMFSYMSRDEMLLIYGKAKNLPKDKTLKLPDEFLEKLRKKQKMHIAKNKVARKNRAERYGSENLTSSEILKQLSSKGDLRFKELRNLDEPFTSVTGAARSKTAFVLVDAKSEEFLCTKAECHKLIDLGVPIPEHALKPSSKANTLKGLFS